MRSAVSFLSLSGPALLWVLAFLLSLKLVPDTGELAEIGCVVAGYGSLIWLLSRGGYPLAQRRVTAPWICGLMLGLMILVLLSGIWSVAPAMTWMHGGAFSFFIATVIVLLLLDRGARDDFLIRAGSGIAVVMAGICIWAFAQILFIPEMLVAGQVRHPFSNPNVFAALLNLLMFTGAGFYLTVENAAWRRAIWILVALYLAVFVSLASKGGMIVMAAGLVLMAVLPRGSMARGWVAGVAGWVAVGLLVAVAFAVLPGRASVVGQIGIFVGNDFATAFNRMDIWMATLEMIRQNPVLGSGFRTFSQIYPSVRLPMEIHSSGLMAHSDPLQFWAEMGVMAPILFYAVALVVLVRFVQVFPAARDPLSAALFVAASGFVAHSHIDFPFYTIPACLAFALVLVLLLGRLYPQAAGGPALPWLARYTPGTQMGILIVPILTGILFFTALMIGEYHTGRARALLAQDDMQGFAEAVNRANQSSFGLHGRPYVMAAVVPLSILKERHGTIGLDEQCALVRQIWSLLDRAEHVHRRMTSVPFHRAEVLIHADPSCHPAGVASAEEYLRQSLAIDRLNLSARILLADRLEQAGRGDDAYAVLLAGVEWPYPRFDMPAYYNRVRVAAQQRGAVDVVARVDAAEARNNRWIAHARQAYFSKMQARFRPGPQFQDLDLKALSPFYLSTDK